jgi:hypothetical protein
MKAEIKNPTYVNGKISYQHQRSASSRIPGVNCFRQVAKQIWIQCGLWGTGEVGANLEECSENFVVRVSPVAAVALRGWSWVGESFNTSLRGQRSWCCCLARPFSPNCWNRGVQNYGPSQQRRTQQKRADRKFENKKKRMAKGIVKCTFCI